LKPCFTISPEKVFCLLRPAGTAKPFSMLYGEESFMSVFSSSGNNQPDDGAKNIIDIFIIHGKRLCVSFFIIILLSLVFGCKSYRSNIMFQLNGEDYSQMMAITDIESNYIIRPNDYLSIEVFTNHGERIIDPDFELVNINQRAYLQERGSQQYLVMDNGFVKLPMVGAVKLEGLTLNEAEKVLEASYNEFYNDVFVILKCNNKRMIVLGALGGHVVPLRNENMNLLEVLALAGGINDNAKSYNIRLIRGDLSKPEVQLIDLSTIEGMRKANLRVLSDDVVYVEPVRRTVPESLRDIAPVLSLFTTVVTLFVLFRSL
jgi:polysaccharide biosynthesis/export protein